MNMYKPIDRHWKVLMWLPILLLIFSVAILAYSLATTGEALKKDIELSGGKLIEVEVGDVDLQKISSEMPYASIRLISGVKKSLLVQFPVDMDENVVFEKLKAIAEVESDPSFRTIEPLLGDLFFQQTQIALIIAFVFMSIVIFVLFRALAPSIAVVLAAITDIVVTIGIMNVFGIELSLPVVAALLTLIGYSVDTDILLTSRLLKSGSLTLEEIPERIDSAMKTGLTMTFTALAALSALYFIASSSVLHSIALVLIIGIVIDIFATWLTNAGILRLWLLRKSKRSS
ncbi:MAG TPA: protein translocase subunit SecF [archaeon]|nr:protein translocase subunit SecF [archaeon]